MLRTLILWKPLLRASAESDRLPCLLQLPAAPRDAVRRDSTNVGQRAANDGRVPFQASAGASRFPSGAS